MQEKTIENLKKVIALNDLPEDHLQWILNHTEYKEYQDGALIFQTGDPADTMWLAFEGKVEFYMNINGKLVHYFTFANDAVTGGAGGLLPYSRMKTIPGNSYASGTVKSFQLHKKYFTELEQLNPELIQRLVGYMTERARHFAIEKSQKEKISALGQLAAGIAHELNNPASAIDRISSELMKRLARNYRLTEKLLQHGIQSEHIQSIRNLVETKEKEPSKKLTPLQRIEKEEEVTSWLEEKGMLGNHIIGETFAEAGFTSEDLENIRGNVGKEPFIHVLHWLENLLNSQQIMKDLEEASGRISHLVSAIKSHVHMDRTHELQPTNIHTDIDNTVTLLGYKLRDKNIEVKKKFCYDLQDVPAYIGELNQVWTNLIDNAIYAMPKGGELIIETICDSKNVQVNIIDNGSGIPEEIRSRIFDPFFTTKKMGDGTGIGLDIVNRIVKHHNGQIKVNSKPGRTEFEICIPLIPEKNDKQNKPA